ncbi:MAG: L,D-transpeptidase [Beijerinckiaceae bacterium]
MNLRFFSWALPFVALSLGGCYDVGYSSVPDPSLSARDQEYMAIVPQFNIDPAYHRYLVDDPTGEAPGTVIVDTKEKFLYFVLPKKKAIRYGVAVGAEAYGWTGIASVGRMAEWPHWMPPADMLERWPHLKPTADAGGLPGGPDNPLGSRALYLYQGDKDTLYRIHGTNEPDKIGTSVSSGCIRMTDIDAIDLYNRVKVGTKVVVM